MKAIKQTTRSLDGIRQKLVARKLELEEQLAELYKEKGFSDQVLDSGDQALSSIMESLRTSLHDSELQEYNMILNALRMIDDGSYGMCVDCGQPISEKRLISYPNATRCLVCQELKEDVQAES